MFQTTMSFPFQLTLLLLFLSTAASWHSSTSAISQWTRRRNSLITTQTRLRTSTTDNEIVLNPLLNVIEPSKTVEIFGKVKELEASGVVVTSLCVGEPDFLPPEPVLKAIAEAATTGNVKYTAVSGTLQLRQAILKDLETRKNISYYKANDVVVGNGAKQCVFQGMLAVAGQGDKVLIPAPYWPSYPDMAKLCGATPIILNTRAEEGYLLQPQSLQQALQQHPETKLLVLCHPSNPTGSVYSKAQLEEIVSVLKKFPQVFVLADEIYERLVYDGMEHVSMASLLPERTILVNGFSKAYAMTGLRLGYAAAPTPIAKAIATIQSQLTSCASSVAQAAGVAALTQVDEEQLQVLYDELQTKRDYVLSELAKIPGVRVAVPPSGAFYVMPCIEDYCDNKDDVAICKELLERHQLALVPGSSFGAPNTVRISYATSLSELVIAMHKLADFFAEERSKKIEN